MGHAEDRTVAVARGAVAGTVATAAMSLAMEAGRRVGSFRRQSPKLIVRTALGGHPARTVGGEDLLTVLAHVGYGVFFGAVLGLLTRRHHGAGVPLGIGYALLLWLVSYAGWVPAAGAMAPPQRDDRGRQLTMVVGHVVYGAVSSAVLGRLRGSDAAG